MIQRSLLVALALLLGVGCATAPLPAPAPVPGIDAADEPEEPVDPVAAPPGPTPETAANAPASSTDDAAPGRIDDGRELFDRLSTRLSPPICVRGDHNRQWRRRYAGDPHAFERQLRGALPLIAYVVEAVEARGLPGEFALIPLIESGYRPEARGPGGPTGLWQMIGSTARNHGVQVGRGYDGRLSPVDSTTAALDYLAALHAEFGDWRAAAMAYNAGEGRLRRAFARDGARRVSAERRLPTGLSTITYAYVAKLHALACLVAEPARHGLTLPDDAFAPLDVRRLPDGARRLDAAARAWDVDPRLLARWNPAYRQGIASAAAPRELLVPASASTHDAATSTLTASAPSAGASAAASGTRTHRVRRGDTLWALARRYGTTVRTIAEANGINASAALHVGQRLLIPK